MVIYNIFHNFATTNPRHKILGNLENGCIVYFNVSNLERICECLFLNCVLDEFIFFQLNFDDF